MEPTRGNTMSMIGSAAGAGLAGGSAAQAQAKSKMKFIEKYLHAS